LEATITLEYDDEKTAEAVANAVSPDNYKTPADLTVTTKRKHNVVTTEIKAEGKIVTFIATIDDLLFSVSVAEKTLKAVQPR
jgi:tRNA threonylcarbamoyladenosine modification (KEOPS) complex  Pcc1 subunit